MNKRLACMVLLITVIHLFPGCATIGRFKDFRSFDEKGLTQIKPGHTTASEVTKLFGAPSHIVKLANGNAYMYERSLSKGTAIWLIIVTLGNLDTQYDRIVFFFNRDDVVTHYGSSFNMDMAAYGMPF